MLLDQYECGPIAFSGLPDASYERRLVLDHVVRPEQSDPRQRFEAVAWALRDLLSQRWLKTDATYDRANPKQVYYLSMEFLIGRSLANNILNLRVEPIVREAMEREKLDWAQLVEMEPDAGLGNGGLGRLAACFLDSMATLQLPAIGYGLRYEYGIFRQEIADGRQVEHPDHWLRRPDPWEVSRPREAVEVGLNCAFKLRRGGSKWSGTCRRPLVGTPHDRPVVGYGGRTVNTLRLWGAATHRGLQLPGVQPRRLLRRRPRESRGRVAHAGPLPRRLDAPRQRLAVRPGVFPGRLLAGRYRRAVPPPRQRLAALCPTRSRSSSTIPTRRWPSPS